MKKFLCLLMMIVMVMTISSFSMIAFAAQGTEIITNGNFSSDDISGWESQSGANFTRTDLGWWLSHDYVMEVTNRTESYSSPVWNIYNGVLDWGWGDYTISARVKLDNASSANFSCVVKCNIEDEDKWFSQTITANDDGFTTINQTITIEGNSADATLASAILYFQMDAGINYYIDDISFRKTDASTQHTIEQPSPKNNGPVVNRPQDTSVGVIRWDAWLDPNEAWQDASNPSDTRTIGKQMVDSLSPAQYRYRTPFFAKVLGANLITFPKYTQAIFDQEMRYAKEAGIDYFVYCWYADSDVMSTARKLHATSKYRNDVKMSAFWSIHGMNADTMEYMIDCLKQSYWYKVDGRPLVYIEGANATTVYKVNKLRQACIEAGVGNPYLIGNAHMENCTPDIVKNIGLDAISTYAVSLGNKAEYSSLVTKEKAQWETWKSGGVEVVPIVTTGWNRDPRVEHPVSWEAGNSGQLGDYTKDATAYEIANHLQDAIDFNNKYQSSANTVLMYAWNEHDEGGWICPTIVDDNRDGNPDQTYADGTYKRDYSRLQAIQQVLRPGATWTLDDTTIKYGFVGATLNIGSTLTINYYANAAAGCKAVFTMNGNTVEVTGVYDSEQRAYRFAFTGINPQCMNDIVDAKLFDASGREIDFLNGYSVRQYCNNLVEDIDKVAEENNYTSVQKNMLLKLLAATLNYGAEAQIYRDYKTDTLANSEKWVRVYEGAFTVPTGVKVINGNRDTQDYVSNVSLSISNVNRIYFRFVLNSDNVVITLDGKQYTKDQLNKEANGTYTLYTTELAATQFDQVFHVTLTKNGVEISSIYYNVKAYIQSKYTSSTVGAISMALNNYGDAANYFVDAMMGEYDDDFDLGFDDFFTNNVIPSVSGNFDNAISAQAAGWSTLGGIPLNLVDDGKGGKALSFDFSGDPYQNYLSPTFNLAPYVKPGTYALSFRYKVTGDMTSFNTTIRDTGWAEGYNGFDNNITAFDKNVWYEFSDMLTITENNGSQAFYFCIHAMYGGAGTICIDDLTVVFEYPPEEEQLVTNTETWIANEMTFIASNPAKNQLTTQTFDVEFTNGNKTITMPGFWDGSNIWRVRFALPSAGKWIYTTKFSDTTDGGVHNKTGEIIVSEYSGDLDIYKHGFVKTDANKRYFVYADGTPFFYLGDTHWSMLAEEFDSAGSRADGIETNSHFKYIVDKRVEQGFTVYQSEPLEAQFDLTNGLDKNDIKGFRIADKYFQYIAEKGLVHANSQFFFASDMSKLVEGKSQAEYQATLDILTRYWIARYGAYPVMYTLAQEVDNDHYSAMNITPWKYVCETLYKYDPYKNPISAHQEAIEHSLSQVDKYNETSASNSAFGNVQGHTWWATQWKAKLNDEFNYEIVKDYWNNGQGKPVVSYEGNYDGYWTNEYGARAQGWVAFLNGMAGHGYGAIDMWYYGANFDNEALYERNGITISVEGKRTHWGTSIKYATGDQMGYMREFFEQYEWWNLTPAFGDSNKLSKTASHFLLASIGTDLYIAYIFDGIAKNGTTNTGTIKGLDSNANYTYQWFNPRTGETSQAQAVNKTNNTQFNIGARPSTQDWVLVVQKVK